MYECNNQPWFDKVFVMSAWFRTRVQTLKKKKTDVNPLIFLNRIRISDPDPYLLKNFHLSNDNFQSKIVAFLIFLKILSYDVRVIFTSEPWTTIRGLTACFYPLDPDRDLVTSEKRINVLLVSRVFCLATNQLLAFVVRNYQLEGRVRVCVWERESDRKRERERD